MPVGHQLAAIIFTDIVGYTTIMQRDENAALEKVQRFRQILESRSAEYYGNPWATSMNIITLARLGKVDEAKNLFSQIDTAGSSLPAFSKGLIYFNLGEKEKAFRWLQQSYNDRDFWLVSLKVDPIWDDLRTDKRFFGLIGKMNFPH